MIIDVPEDNLLLTLTPDNVSNTVLISEDGERLYTVITEHTKKTTVTSVRNSRDDVIASLEWRDVLPDKVTVGKNKPVLVTDWMKRSLIPFKDDISFVDDRGRKYKWKGNSAGRSFELFCADDSYASAITRFQRSRRVHPKISSELNPNASTPSLAPTLVNPVWTPATLTLTPRAMQIQDLVISSFLFLEKTHRTNEQEHQVRADALGTPAMGVLGRYRVSNGGV
ncbi:hypothetical protein PHLGIDRAFT_127291 [Phlebiopsis gigantea 11061_1 CR5-6]|uniref:DUF6593 domain-containing protein n=1 Tax=Phlebiopsis gigantea (strain 11061_1 CR5-6) TaxID=745531 RepID=A0A0C3PMW1_PHLG1|nr:hypothetical protein PHLGIDRAFT_127291 [Phlebiopsis gigantea 11061_1 CR5-6]